MRPGFAFRLSALLLLTPASLPAQSFFPDDVVVGDGPPQGALVPVASAPQLEAFLGTTNQPALRTRFKLQLQARIAAVDSRWPLTVEQREKLQLAGRGDIARWNAEIAQLRRESADHPRAPQELHEEVIRRITIPSERMFGDESLYFKVLRKQLTERQWLRFEEVDRAERCAQVRTTIAQFYSGKHQLSQTQQRDLAEAYLSKYPRWGPLSRNVNCSQYVTMLIAAELGDEIKPIFTDDQWWLTQNHMRTARALEPQFRSYGLWPIEDAEPRMGDD